MHSIHSVDRSVSSSLSLTFDLFFSTFYFRSLCAHSVCFFVVVFIYFFFSPSVFIHYFTMQCKYEYPLGYLHIWMEFNCNLTLWYLFVDCKKKKKKKKQLTWNWITETHLDDADYVRFGWRWWRRQTRKVHSQLILMVFVSFAHRLKVNRVGGCWIRSSARRKKNNDEKSVHFILMAINDNSLKICLTTKCSLSAVNTCSHFFRSFSSSFPLSPMIQRFSRDIALN